MVGFLRNLFSAGSPKSDGKEGWSKHAIDDAGQQGRANGASKRKFVVTQVSEGVRGRPILHVEPAPLSHDGIPEVSEDLARAIRPYLKDSDNISIRFIDHGLPTTTTAVLGSYDIGESNSSITYELRIMLFDTGTRKIGSNVHLRPIRRNAVLAPGVPVSQDIVGARTYEFREAYDNNDHSQADLERLARIAHSNFHERSSDVELQAGVTEDRRESPDTATGSSGSEWSGWQIRGNEVLCAHRVRNHVADRPTECQIHCTLKSGITGEIHPFLNVLVRWPFTRLKEQEGLEAAFSTRDDSVQTGRFPVRVSTATDGSAVINVISRDSVRQCLNIFRSGQGIVFSLATKDGTSVLGLRNDGRFAFCYDECHRQLRTGRA